MSKNRSRNTLAAILSAALMGTSVAPLSSCDHAQSNVVVQPTGARLTYQLDLPTDESTAATLRVRTQQILEDRLRSAGIEHTAMEWTADDRIEIRVADDTRREQADRLIGTPGHFAAHIVASSDYQSEEWKKALRDPEAPAPTAETGRAGLLLLEFPESGHPESEKAGLLVVLDGPRHTLDGHHVRRAQVSPDEFGFPGLAVELDTAGAEKLARITAANIAHRLALRVDGRVLATPVIQSRVSDPFFISGLEGELARDLEAILSHGPLPVRALPVR